MIQLLGQFPGSPQVNIDFFNYVDRQTNSTGLVHQPTFYGLTDPPGGISSDWPKKQKIKTEGIISN